MESINLFFITVCAIGVFYVMYKTFRLGKRIPTGIDLLYLGFFGLIFTFFAFPSILRFLEVKLGFFSAISFFVYLAIIVAYVILLALYQKLEKQRNDITQLAREIALQKK
jgi:hypothetical protein